LSGRSRQASRDPTLFSEHTETQPSNRPVLSASWRPSAVAAPFEEHPYAEGRDQQYQFHCRLHLLYEQVEEEFIMTSAVPSGIKAD